MRELTEEEFKLAPNWATHYNVFDESRCRIVFCNAPVASCDPSGHAEVRALRAAGQQLGNYRLEGCTLFVTLEPCMMCAGAMIHARVARLVYGAAEPRAGMVESKANLLAQPWFNHQVAVTGGVLAPASRKLLKHFFAERRDQLNRQ